VLERSNAASVSSILPFRSVSVDRTRAKTHWLACSWISTLYTSFTMDTVAPAVYVPPLIPECADERLSSQAGNPEEAQNFQPDTTYVLTPHWPC